MKDRWVVLIAFAMTFAAGVTTGWEARDVKGFEERDSLWVAQRIELAERLEEVVKLWVECRRIDTWEACEDEGRNGTHK